jgi:hypothetical protein
MPEELVTRWRSEAKILRRRGAIPQAEVLEECAQDLEEALRHHDEDTLTLAEASQASGYTADHLGRLVRDGRLHNAGKRNAPRIRRCDLPQKGSHFDRSPGPSHLGSASKEQIARSIVANGGLR